MADASNGLLVHVGPGNGDTSPTGQLVLRLDSVYDDLMDDQDGVSRDDHQEKVGEARGLAFALQVISQYSQPEIKQQMKIRWQRRQETKS